MLGREDENLATIPGQQVNLKANGHGQLMVNYYW